MTSVVVVGGGLIGGSMALGLAAAGWSVTVVDPCPCPADWAQDCPNLTWETGDAVSSASLLAQADLVVLAAPVQVIARTLLFVLATARAVTDCGSTKRVLVERARESPHGSRYVPGHPMAGAPRGGSAAADPALFRGRRWLMCPAGVDPEPIRLVREMVAVLGATVVELDPDDHDRAVAMSSHVPQLLASALAVVGGVSAREAAGPAYERVTLGAGGPEEMWRDIFATNGPAIAEALRELIGRLEAIAGELEFEETDAALQVLREARELQRPR